MCCRGVILKPFGSCLPSIITTVLTSWSETVCFSTMKMNTTGWSTRLQTLQSESRGSDLGLRNRISSPVVAAANMKKFHLAETVGSPKCCNQGRHMTRVELLINTQRQLNKPKPRPSSRTSTQTAMTGTCAPNKGSHESTTWSTTKATPLKVDKARRNECLLKSDK